MKQQSGGGKVTGRRSEAAERRVEAAEQQVEAARNRAHKGEQSLEVEK